MRKLKLLTASVLSIALLFTAAPVQAAEQYTPELIYPEGIEERAVYADSRAASYENMSVEERATVFRELEKRITDTLLAGEYIVDLTGIDMDYHMFLEYYDMCPYFGKGIRPFNFDQGEEMGLINPFPEEETAEILNTVNGKIAEIDSLITEDMSDLQKALAIHDYFVYRFEYDYDNYMNGTIPAESYQCIGLLLNGTGVCQAYALAYEYFMERVGVECYYTGSSAMNHAWNIINIDGQYYHVDCTWDDPVYDRFGQVSHEHFLVSDEAMQNSREHYGWDRTDLVCDDTQYDNAYWTEIDSQIIQDGEREYYLKGSSLYCREGSSEEAIAYLGTWPVWQGSGWWTSAFSGLFYRNGYLYFNTYSRIMRIDPETMETEPVYEPELTEGYIYGIRDQGDKVQYMIKQRYSDKGTIYTAPISLAVPAESITLDQSDITLTAGESLLLKAEVKPENASADLMWSSVNPDIASVDQNGLVIGKTAGNTVIKVQSGDVSAECRVTVKEPEYILGDVNSDGKKDISDLRMILRAVCGKVELTEQQKLAADVEKDSADEVNISDLRKMLRFICGKIESLE